MSLIHALKCECEKELSFNCFLDSDDDLIVEVEACEDCIDSAVAEREEDMQAEIDQLQSELDSK